MSEQYFQLELTRFTYSESGINPHSVILYIGTEMKCKDIMGREVKGIAQAFNLMDIQYELPAVISDIKEHTTYQKVFVNLGTPEEAHHRFEVRPYPR